MSETIEETLIRHMNYIGELTKQRDDLLAVCEAVVRAKDLLVSSEYIDEFSDEATALTKIYTMAKAAIAKSEVQAVGTTEKITR